MTTTVPPPPPPSPDADDRALLDAAQSGDDGAFAQLIERHDPVLGLLATGLLDGTGTDPLLVESYVRAYRSLGRQVGDPEPWLLRTTYLTCLAEARRRERRRIGGPGRLPDRRPLAEEAPLAGLPPDERAVLVLVDGADLDEHVVAEALEVPPATVASLRSRAHARLAADPGRGGAELVAVEHGEGFWADLGQRLLVEREAPAVPVPSLPGPAGDTAADGGAKAPPVAMQRRAPRAAREGRREPDSVDRLAVGAKRRRGRTPRLAVLRRAAAVVAVVAVIGALLVAVVHFGSKAKSPVREDSVAQVAGRVVAALDVDTMAATFTRTTVGPQGTRHVASYQLLRNRLGSYLLVDAAGTRASAYDASTNTRQVRTPPTATIDTGLAAGPPDASPSDAELPDAELDLALRTLAAVVDEKASTATIGATPVWKLAAPLPDSSIGADRVELIVDQDRLAPLSVTYQLAGRVVRTVRFTKVVFGGAAPGPFTVDLAGLSPVTTDRAFRTVSVDDAAAAVGYAPLRPTYLPTGFELAATSVRTEGKVVVLRYQRGFQQVVVTTRASPVAKGAPWPDPFPGAAFRQPQKVAITSGPYRGTTALRTRGLGTVPALWGTDGTLAFTVAGDLTDDQLVRVATSLR